MSIRYELHMIADEGDELNDDMLSSQKIFQLMAGHMKHFYPDVQEFEAAIIEGGQLLIVIGTAQPPADPKLN